MKDSDWTLGSGASSRRRAPLDTSEAVGGLRLVHTGGRDRMSCLSNLLGKKIQERASVCGPSFSQHLTAQFPIYAKSCKKTRNEDDGRLRHVSFAA
jgi:hypothetical protein